MKILLLAGHFPPEKSGGTGRPYSLYKYLPENGLDVCVVTKNLYGGSIPGERDVYRYDCFGSWRKSSWFSRKVLFKMISLVKNRIYDVNYDSWWVNEVLKNADNYISNIDVIYASFPGPDVLEAALKLKANLQIPLIAEFRDGLAFETVLNKPNILQRIVINKLEKRIVNSADAVVTIGQNLSNYFRRTYNKQVYTVYNGYEEDDFDLLADSNNSKNTGKKYLVHFGSLNASRKAERNGLFKSLKLLKSRKVIDENNFCLILIGNISSREKKEIAVYDLNEIIKFLPHMDKKEGFLFLSKQADCLLFYGVPNETTIVSSKLPEYIKLNKPIIGICKGNEAELIIQKTGTGEVCDFDAISIEPLLVKMLTNEIHYQPDYLAIGKFNRKYQAKEIAGIIKDVCL